MRGQENRINFRLRHILAVAFILIATIPVLLLGVWAEQTAMEREMANVSEKHLLLARNLTNALERYAEDTVAIFDFFTAQTGTEPPSPASLDLAREVGFRQFFIFDEAGRAAVRWPIAEESVQNLPQEVMIRLLLDVSDRTAFSAVMADGAGHPALFLTRRLPSRGIAVAAVGVDYFREVQQAIAFGRKGHSVIVDHRGNVIAHPRPDWQREMKNIRTIKPVAQMMAGKTGVETFYAPAFGKEMITGYTTVPGTGWGVMVPQPMEELEAHTGQVRQMVIGLIIIGLVVAGLISWFLSGLLVGPVGAVARAAQDFARGNLDIRVPAYPSGAPVEYRALGAAFNAMANDVATDIAERKMLEDHAYRSQKLEALGQLTGGVAHEFNNLLAAISGNLEMLEDDLQAMPEAREYVTRALNATFKGRDLTDHLLSYTGNPFDRPVVIDVGKSVMDAAAFLRPVVGEKIIVMTSVSHELWPVRIDPLQFRTALISLAVNARDAMPDGGTIAITAANTPLDDAFAARRPFTVKSGDYVRIAVSDTGVGMTPKHVERAFDPFFTTKDVGKGTGLGLSMVYGFVHRQSGGYVEINSTPGSGTTVTLYFPRLLGADIEGNSPVM